MLTIIGILVSFFGGLSGFAWFMTSDPMVVFAIICVGLVFLFAFAMLEASISPARPRLLKV